MKSKVLAVITALAVTLMLAPATFAQASELEASVDENMHVVLTWVDSGHADLEAVLILKSTGEGVEPTTELAYVDRDLETFTDEEVLEGEMVNYQLKEKYDDGTFGPLSEAVTVTVVAAVEEEVVEGEVVCEEDDVECLEEVEVAEEEEMIEAIEFSDIADHWAMAEIEALAAEGILTGNPDGTFAPDGDLDRAEGAAVLYRVLGFDEPALPEDNPFQDVDASAWYAGYISNMKALEMIHGYGDGTYKPAKEISRAEFIKLALEVYYYVEDDEEIRLEIDTLMEGEMTNIFKDLEESWYTPYVTTAGEMGFVSGYACGTGRCFGANNKITRAEAAVMLSNIFIDLLVVEEEVVEEIVEDEVV